MGIFMKRSSVYIKLIEATNQNSIKVPKVVKQRIRKRNYKTLGTSVINSPMFPSSLSTPIVDLLVLGIPLLFWQP